MQNSKMAVGEALHIAVKRREAKSKGEKERYKHLNRPLSLLDTLLIICANSLLERSELGFLRLALYLRSRSLTKALL